MSRVCSSVSLFLHLNVGRNALEMSSIYPTQFCSSCGSSRPRVPNGVARSPAKRFGKPCRELVPDSRIYNLLGVCKSEGQLSFNNSSIPRFLADYSRQCTSSIASTCSFSTHNSIFFDSTEILLLEDWTLRHFAQNQTIFLSI
ncbi:hypothetical protein MPTK1_8g03650 [Marchantia polymorpha subsp. ruderalis]|nr:hypothetical protein Mp_8g03650 [Marchantia polymorpha subsp. ruderalis]